MMKKMSRKPSWPKFLKAMNVVKYESSLERAAALLFEERLVNFSLREWLIIGASVEKKPDSGERFVHIVNEIKHILRNNAAGKGEYFELFNHTVWPQLKNTSDDDFLNIIDRFSNDMPVKFGNMKYTREQKKVMGNYKYAVGKDIRLD